MLKVTLIPKTVMPQTFSIAGYASLYCVRASLSKFKPRILSLRIAPPLPLLRAKSLLLVDLLLFRYVAASSSVCECVATVVTTLVPVALLFISRDMVHRLVRHKSQREIRSVVRHDLPEKQVRGGSWPRRHRSCRWSINPHLTMRAASLPPQGLRRPGAKRPLCAAGKTIVRQSILNEVRQTTRNTRKTKTRR
jgi:hypothetical protein